MSSSRVLIWDVTPSPVSSRSRQNSGESYDGKKKIESEPLRSILRKREDFEKNQFYDKMNQTPDCGIPDPTIRSELGSSQVNLGLGGLKQKSITLSSDQIKQQKIQLFPNLFLPDSDEKESSSVIDPQNKLQPGGSVLGSQKQFQSSDLISISKINEKRDNLRLLQTLQTKGLQKIWNTGALRIAHYISKFITNLKTKTDKVKFRLMTRKIFDIIDDSSSDFEVIQELRAFYIKPTFKVKLKHFVDKTSRVLSRYFKTIQTFFGRAIPVIQPDSVFKTIWDILMLFVTVINIFYLPMRLSFSLEKNQNQAFEYFFNYFPSWLLVWEIFMNFNTAFYHKGIIHNSRREIFIFYLKGSFFIDLLVALGFLCSNLVPYADVTLLLRVNRVKSLVQSLEQVFNLNQEGQAVIELIKLVYFIIFVGHFCACAWHYLAIIEMEQLDMRKCWMSQLGIYDGDTYTRYIYSFYWSTITTLTIGYGDVVPVTNLERLFVIMTALVICGVFGYSITRIGDIIKSLEEKKQITKIQMKIINQHIKHRGVSKALQLKVRKYFEHYFKMQEQESSEAEGLMSQLTKHLKQEVLIDIYFKTLKHSRLLRQNFSEQTVKKLCVLIKEKKFAPEEEIFQRGEIAEKMIFIISGEISIYTEQSNYESNQYYETELRTFKGGYVVGEREFVMNRTYEYNARAVKFTQLALLDREEFIQVLKENPEDFDRFCLIRENLLFNSNYKNLGQVCEICLSNHGFQKCPFVFHQPNEGKITSEYKRSQIQKRFFKSRHRQRLPTRTMTNDVQEAALCLIIMNKLVPEEALTDKFLLELGFSMPDDIENESVRHRSSVIHATVSIGASTDRQRQTIFDQHQHMNQMNQMISFKSADKYSIAESDSDPNSRPPQSTKKLQFPKLSGYSKEIVEEDLEPKIISSILQSRRIKFKLQPQQSKRLSKQISVTSPMAPVISLSPHIPSNEITQNKENDLREFSRSFSRMASKLSVDQGIYDKKNESNPILQNMQFYENKVIEKVIEESSILQSIRSKKIKINSTRKQVNHNSQVQGDSDLKRPSQRASSLALQLTALYQDLNQKNQLDRRFERKKSIEKNYEASQLDRRFERKKSIEKFYEASNQLDRRFERKKSMEKIYETSIGVANSQKQVPIIDLDKELAKKSADVSESCIVPINISQEIKNYEHYDHVELDIDKLHFSNIYYPNFNFSAIVQKLSQFTQLNEDQLYKEKDRYSQHNHRNQVNLKVERIKSKALTKKVIASQQKIVTHQF